MCESRLLILANASYTHLRQSQHFFNLKVTQFFLATSRISIILALYRQENQHHAQHSSVSANFRDDFQFFNFYSGNILIARSICLSMREAVRFRRYLLAGLIAQCVNDLMLGGRTAITSPYDPILSPSSKVSRPRAGKVRR